LFDRTRDHGGTDRDSDADGKVHEGGLVPQRQRGVEGEHGVVDACAGDVEGRHDGVAGELVHDALSVLLEQLLRDGSLERRQDDGLVGLGDAYEQTVAERPAQDGGCPQHLDGRRLESAEAKEHRLAHRFRETEGVERTSLPPRAGTKHLARSSASPSISSSTNGFPSVRAGTSSASSALTSSAPRMAAIISAT
jgi:hypothetical protein